MAAWETKRKWREWELVITSPRSSLLRCCCGQCWENTAQPGERGSFRDHRSVVPGGWTNSVDQISRKISAIARALAEENKSELEELIVRYLFFRFSLFVNNSSINFSCCCLHRPCVWVCVFLSDYFVSFNSTITEYLAMFVGVLPASLE